MKSATRIRRLLGSSILAAGIATSHALAEPGLEGVPGPAPVTEGLPGPAAWPVRRYERPLHLLAVTGKGASVAGYQRIARRMRSTIEFRYFSPPGDDQAIYHVNDKWIEPKDHPTAAELSQYSLDVIADTLRVKDGKPPAEVIFCDRLDWPGLLDCVNAGAVLVTCGSVYPDSNSVFFAEWPARSTPRNTWMSGGAQRADGAALSGLPLQRLAGHTWIPLAEATEGSSAFSTGESGAVFSRKVGQGAIVFVPTGLMSRYWAAISSFGRQYDHDEIWLRLWDQLLYETIRGAVALPAYTDVRPGAPEALPAADYVLPGRIVNRTATGPLGVSVHVTTPRGEVVYGREETLEVPAGGEQAYEVHVPVAPDWPTGLYPVYLTVGDPASKQQFHQSLELIPVTGPLALALSSDKRGYRLGEEATFTLTASSGAPWSGTLSFGVYDFRGRLLAVSEQPANFTTTNAPPFTFRYRLVDHGVRVDTLWAEVAALREGREWGRAEAKFYQYEPWSMRNEYQWSTWAGIACAPPSLVPGAMRLMAHAGMNAFGYPGRNELHYPAERWGWRYYNEGIGMNTFSPVIEYENDAEIEEAMLKQAAGRAATPDLNTAAFVLASVGEEAGYQSGWGRTYYWEEPVAPEKACRAFQWYLKTKYGELPRLNTTWKTNFQSWDEIKLTQEFSGAPPKLEADGWAHPKESPLGAGVSGVSLAPYSDTKWFYAWYYDRIIAAAKGIFREQINPVALTMASAPSSWIFESRECDVRLAGPGGWNESQMHSTLDGPEPGFSLVWGHFDWLVKTDNLFWGYLLTRSGHNNYWVDIPLMFNNDLTHTRASFAMRRWTQKLAGHERIILDSRPAPSDVGLLGANGLGTELTRANMATSLQVALNQGGFALPRTDRGNLETCKIVFAIGHQAVSAEEAEQLDQYVRNGGVLVFTPRFANQDEFGAPQAVSPGQGLAAKWGLEVTNRVDNIPQYYPVTMESLPLDGVSETLRGLQAATHSVFREQVKQSGWSRLAEYEDHSPAILTRQLGKGKLFFINMVYQSHHYIQWVTPTGPERQGFYKLVEWLCEQANAARTLRLEGDLNQVLHAAVKQFTDATGQIRYVVLRTSGEVPWTAGRLAWLGPQAAGYDVLDGREVGKQTAWDFQPGDGKLFAFTTKRLQRLRVKAFPSRITAGEAVQVSVQILGRDGRSVPGVFPLELTVRGPNGEEIPGLRRSYSAASGEKRTLQTALSDPGGRWTVTVTDGIRGLSGEATLTVRAPRELADAPGFVAWGWPSEIEEPAVLRPEQFIARLRALAELYRTGPSGPGWMTKQRLGYFYNFFPNTRHAILQPLLDVDWPAYSGAIREALAEGTELILTGEDLGIHPGSALGVYPHHDARQLAALTQALQGAQWSLASPDGDTIAAALGQGRVVLCRESIDAAGHDSPGIMRWHLRWRSELLPGDAPSIPAPAPDRLHRWWTGQEAITERPRVVRWFEGNHRELKFTVEARQPLGEVFAFIVPPTGEVREVEVEAEIRGPGWVRFDVGCDGVPDTDWRQALRSAAQIAAHRDDSGWRIVPVGVTSTDQAEVTLRGVRLVVQ